MSKVSFKLVGGDRTLKAIGKVSKEAQQKVYNALEAASLDIVRKAIERAPADYGGGGGIRSGIHSGKKGKFNFEVVSARDYSAYVEFGTGAYVKVPAGLEDYAIQFKGKGIREVNLPARPFFFNTSEEVRIRLIQEIKDILKEI